MIYELNWIASETIILHFKLFLYCNTANTAKRWISKVLIRYQT